MENATIKENGSYKYQVASANARKLAKSLTQVRGSEATPEYMWQKVQAMCQDQPLVKEVVVLTGRELEEKGMNLFWNVGKGAAVPPRCVVVHYQGRTDSADVDLAIVGKGVTYDTGGLNIKTSMMELMYGDKGCACAVLGALQGCLDLKLEKNVVFACAFAENAIGKDAYKPADILTAMNGLSVEINNTDAEGRLVMADTMTFVQRTFNPKSVMYIATLTGSVGIALGTTTAGLFSTNDEMVEAIKKAGDDSFEPVWQLPLNDEHRESIAGQFGSDIANTGASRMGGSSTAAAFLERFVEEDRPWAHLDIGPGIFMEKDSSGFGAKLLLEYVNSI